MGAMFMVSQSYRREYVVTPTKWASVGNVYILLIEPDESQEENRLDATKENGASYNTPKKICIWKPKA